MSDQTATKRDLNELCVCLVLCMIVIFIAMTMAIMRVEQKVTLPAPSSSAIDMGSKAR